MCTGNFIFGDVESGATMRLEVSTKKKSYILCILMKFVLV